MTPTPGTERVVLINVRLGVRKLKIKKKHSSNSSVCVCSNNRNSKGYELGNNNV